MAKTISLFTMGLFMATGHAATFVQGPSLAEAGGIATLTFSISDPADVEAAVLDSAGKVVRHLAAGVLGGTPPAPLQAGTLSQTLSWDGLDDYGNPVRTGPFKVRVRIGVTPQFEKSIHLKDAAMIPPAYYPAWSDTVNNFGWGPDTVADTSEILSVTDPVLFTGMRSAATGLALYDGGITMIDMGVSKETDEIVFQHATWTGGAPTMLLLNGVTGQRLKLWSQSVTAYGEPVMDWFGRFYLKDRGYNPCSPDLYRYTLNGTALNYSWGSNMIDMPVYSNDGIRQEGFCNDQYGNIYQAHYPRDTTRSQPYYVSKWDSIGGLIHDSLIMSYTAMQGIRTDLQGNIFICVKLKPLGDTVPGEIRGLLSGAWDAHAPFSQAAIADEAYGSIVKFGPQGGSIVDDPAGPYYKQSFILSRPFNSRASVNGAKWVHYGSSFVFTKVPYANDMTVCCCYNPRFDVDRFGRVIYPDPFNHDFHALDNNGNPVFRVHNRDLFPSVSVGAIVNIQATDRGLYLGDHINNQIIITTWKADAETTLNVSSTLAERLRPVHGPLEMSNFPNPFKASTIIRIRGEGALDGARLVIYNLNGRRIVDLTPSLRAGAAQVKWDGSDASGKKVPSGLYCCRLSSGAKTVHNIMLLTK